jgi:GntR family transcriptional regulator, transcriptional repressor for pyruvate dehydrogenase complex
MQEYLEPIKSDSLVDVFINRFENLILSGTLTIGQRLPSERELSLQLGVSRPVVHEGLLHLESKGLVTMIPRVGTVVNDYRREGSLVLLDSLVHYHRGRLETKLFESLLQMRYLVELETARLAALNATTEHDSEFRQLILDEEGAAPGDTAAVTELDFRFHHLVALASGNIIYPLMMNSFKDVYTNLTSFFFRDHSVVATLFGQHRAMAEAISRRDEANSVSIMREIIEHGERHLKSMLSSERFKEVP